MLECRFAEEGFDAHPWFVLSALSSFDDLSADPLLAEVSEAWCVLWVELCAAKWLAKTFRPCTMTPTPSTLIIRRRCCITSVLAVAPT